MGHEESMSQVVSLGFKDRLFRNGLFQLPQNAAEKPRLIGQRCISCGVYLFPPQGICPKCLQNDKMEQVLLGPYGKLFTYSIVRQGPPHYAKAIPYAIGYVDLEEGVRVFAQLWTQTFEELRIGLDMELFIHKLYTDADGMNVIGYKFRTRQAD
jgi:hypothetical protein